MARWERAWIALLVWLGVSTPAWAMEQCPPGTGQVDRWPFFAGIGLAVVLVLVRLTLLRSREDKPSRIWAQIGVVLLAVFSSCGACSTLVAGVMFCPRNTQAPEVLCDHFESLAAENPDLDPVEFDHSACLEAWRTERKQLSSSRYRDLSSCARGLALYTIAGKGCTRDGFDLSRHAPGHWPPPIP